MGNNMQDTSAGTQTNVKKRSALSLAHSADDTGGLHTPHIHAMRCMRAGEGVRRDGAGQVPGDSVMGVSMCISTCVNKRNEEM